MAPSPPLADLEGRLANRLAEALNAYRRAIAERLEGESRRLVAAISELQPSAPGGLVGDADLEQLTERPREEGAHEAVSRLAAALRGLDAATTQAEALDALLAGARAWADRVALVLVDEAGLDPWGERGFTRFASGAPLVWSAELRALWLGDDGCRRHDEAAAAEALEPFGATAAGPAVVVPLVLRDRVAALLWADREAGPPELGALQLLVHAASARLELQALSARAHSPTLYAAGEAPGAALPLWSTVAEPAAVEEEAWEPLPAAAPEAAVEPVEEMFEEAAEEPAAVEPSFEAPAEEPTAAEEMFEVAAAEPAEVEEPAALAAPEPAAESAGEREPAFDYEVVEEPPAPTFAAPEPPPAPEPPAAAVPLDPLGTLRMTMPAFPSGPPARPSEETTAPFPVVPPPAGPSITHEIPRPEPPRDITEDATLLSTPRPALPEAPAPAAAPPASRPEEAMDRTGARFPRSTEVAPPPDLEGPGRAFLDHRFGRPAAEPQHEEAKRLARLLISEIKLYNEEQVLEGRRNRDLYHRLREDIDRSRQIYDERVDATVRTAADYFHQELVRSLAGGDPRALGI